MSLCAAGGIEVTIEVGGRTRAFVREPGEPFSSLLIPALFGDLPAEAGVREQMLGDFRRVRHGTLQTA